jgi:glycine/D-amino acid oxidase-like deaminating enzyme
MTSGTEVETLIIGGGQAGLAVSYFLKQAGQEHLIIDAAEKAAHAWRDDRWDSFTSRSAFCRSTLAAGAKKLHTAGCGGTCGSYRRSNIQAIVTQLTLWLSYGKLQIDFK